MIGKSKRTSVLESALSILLTLEEETWLES